MVRNFPHRAESLDDAETGSFWCMITSSGTTVNTQGVHVRRQGLVAAAVACPKVRAARWLGVESI